MSRFFQNHAAGGFRLDSPVKKPVASEMLRCAPLHTNWAGEEPCKGDRLPSHDYSRKLGLQLCNVRACI